MTGGVKLKFAATTINEAVLAATEKWRVLAEDPEAVLPWQTHFEFAEEVQIEEKDGRLVEGGVQMMCGVTIEFDRGVIDTLTGSGVVSTTS